MTRKSLVAGLLVAAMLSLSGCGGSNLTQDITEESLMEQNKQQARGNFLIQDARIYGTTSNRARSGNSWENQLCSAMRADPFSWNTWDDRTVLLSGDDPIRYLTLATNGYLYFMQRYDGEGAIYRMPQSGGTTEWIADAYGEMQIVEDYIYYAASDTSELSDHEPGAVLAEEAHLYRCDLDGKNVTEIISKPTFNFFVFDQCILYQDDNDGESLHLCKLDGSEDKKLNNVRSYSPIYDGEFIYYRVQNDAAQFTLWRMRPSGGEAEQVSNHTVRDFQITDTSIYFINGDDNYRIYRMDKDGKNVVLVVDEEQTYGLQVVGDMLTYLVQGFNYRPIRYCCNLDGSDNGEFGNNAF